MNPSHFLELYLFKVMGIDVVPELSKKGVTGVVVYVGLLVSHLEVRAKSRRNFKRRDRRSDRPTNGTSLKGP